MDQIHDDARYPRYCPVIGQDYVAGKTNWTPSVIQAATGTRGLASAGLSRPSRSFLLYPPSTQSNNPLDLFPEPYTRTRQHMGMIAQCAGYEIDLTISVTYRRTIGQTPQMATDEEDGLIRVTSKAGIRRRKTAHFVIEKEPRAFGARFVPPALVGPPLQNPGYFHVTSIHGSPSDLRAIDSRSSSYLR
ncbi:hypothetical protein Bbelb_274460 [Branchiostoma belcheri]|nr:hypothetical protein Bbelb_274460 [Branchiostoma belcheri]